MFTVCFIQSDKLIRDPLKRLSSTGNTQRANMELHSWKVDDNGATVPQELIDILGDYST